MFASKQLTTPVLVEKGGPEIPMREPKEHLLEDWVLKKAEEVKQKAIEHHARTGRWI